MTGNDKHIYSKIHYYLSLALATFPILPLKYGSALVILWSVSAGLTALLNNKQYFVNGFKTFVLFSAIFWLAAAALLYTDDTKEGVFLLEKNLSLLVFPLCLWIAFPHFNKTQIYNVLMVFCGSTIIKALLSSFVLFSSGMLNDFPAKVPFYYRYRTCMETLSGLHPTYFSILLLFSVLFLIYFITSKKWKWLYSLHIVMAIILFIHAAFLASRSPLLAFIVSAVIMLFPMFSGKKKIYFSAAIVVAILASVLTVPSLQERIAEVGNTELKMPEGVNVNPTNIRFGIYKCSWELASDNWILGLGHGDIQQHLDDCYKQFNTYIYQDTPFNTHNIYFNSWLGSGILGLLATLAMLFVPLIWAIKKGKSLYIAFLVFMIICGLTENIFNRQIGVVFYAYMNVLLYWYSFKSES